MLQRTCGILVVVLFVLVGCRSKQEMQEVHIDSIAESIRSEIVHHYDSLDSWHQWTFDSLTIVIDIDTAQRVTPTKKVVTAKRATLSAGQTQVIHRDTIVMQADSTAHHTAVHHDRQVKPRHTLLPGILFTTAILIIIILLWLLLILRSHT